MNDNISLIARRLLDADKAVFFTGAGISTESGIPDYRSKGGIWERYRPIYFDEFMSSNEARAEYWRRKAAFYPELLKAKPNPAHLAVAKLIKKDVIQAVITQNVDGLHQESGVPDDQVIELHGNTRRVRCMSCGKTGSIHDAQKRVAAGEEAPACACGGYLKPDTISFGQSMPLEALERAIRLSKTCDFFMVVGSTLLVQPAAGLPFHAMENSAFMAVINLSETPLDGQCDVLIREKAGEVLPKIAKAVSDMD